MKTKLAKNTISRGRNSLDHRLAAYAAAASAVGVSLASDAEAVIVGNSTTQAFGVNGEVNIDFNNDGQIDFQIDHDRVNVGAGTDLDYLQIDKNDVNGEANPLPFDPLVGFQAQTFAPGATVPNDANQSAYLITGAQGSYPAALSLGAPIGPASTFDWQESADFQGGGKDIRANRLIDEDATQIDQILGGQPASGVQVPFSGPNFVGLGGQVRYLGLKMDLNNADSDAVGGPFSYGWIGIRIDNEADATGVVVGYAYETTPGVAIPAGVVPEPGGIVMAAMGGVALLGAAARRRFRGKKLG